MLALLYDAGRDPMTADGAALPFLGRSASLSDQVAGVLAERVLAGTWPAGHRIPSEPELVEMFGVSRTVVRDAVRTLAARGLVEVRQGSGTVVRGEPEEPYADALLRSAHPLGRDARRSGEGARGDRPDAVPSARPSSASDDDVARLRAAYADLCAAAEAADWEQRRERPPALPRRARRGRAPAGARGAAAAAAAHHRRHLAAAGSQRARVVGRPVAPADPRGDRGAATRPPRSRRCAATTRCSTGRTTPTCSRGACATCRAESSRFLPNYPAECFEPKAQGRHGHAVEVQRRIEAGEHAVLEIGKRIGVADRVDRHREVRADPGRQYLLTTRAASPRAPDCASKCRAHSLRMLASVWRNVARLAHFLAM